MVHQVCFSIFSSFLHSFCLEVERLCFCGVPFRCQANEFHKRSSNGDWRIQLRRHCVQRCVLLSRRVVLARSGKKIVAKKAFFFFFFLFCFLMMMAAKHPGGSVISFYDNMDATDVFNAFHLRSEKAQKWLETLPRRPVTKDDPRYSFFSPKKLLCLCLMGLLLFQRRVSSCQRLSSIATRFGEGRSVQTNVGNADSAISGSARIADFRTLGCSQVRPKKEKFEEKLFEKQPKKSYSWVIGGFIYGLVVARNGLLMHDMGHRGFDIEKRFCFCVFFFLLLILCFVASVLLRHSFGQVDSLLFLCGGNHGICNFLEQPAQQTSCCNSGFFNFVFLIDFFSSFFLFFFSFVLFFFSFFLSSNRN
jgi:hypothetical protein